MKTVSVGFGYDVHRLVKGRKLVLGGVIIPSKKGLDGHSDADVLLHAVMDAILGAAGLGDIGQWFPNTDKKYKNISSILLLKEVVRVVKKKGYSIGNVDTSLILETPKVMPYAGEIKSKVSRVLGIPAGKVNIKATTNEGLGFIGRRQGACAYAVAALYK